MKEQWNGLAKNGSCVHRTSGLRMTLSEHSELKRSSTEGKKRVGEDWALESGRSQERKALRYRTGWG